MDKLFIYLVNYTLTCGISIGMHTGFVIRHFFFARHSPIRTENKIKAIHCAEPNWICNQTLFIMKI